MKLKMTCLSLAVASVFACASAQAAEHSLLPIGGDTLRAQGYDLPEPFGVNVSYTNIRQDVRVNRIGIDGLSLMKDSLTPLLGNLGIPALQHNIPLPANTFMLNAGKTRMRSYSTIVRFDAWLLPFMNVYAVAGKTHGDSVSQVSVRLSQQALPQIANNVSTEIVSSVQSLIAAHPELAGSPQLANLATSASPEQIQLLLPIFFAQNQLSPQALAQGINGSATLNFKGTTYGGGVTFSGGYGNAFASLDANFTQTRFDVLDGHINTFTLTPRAGYRFDISSQALPDSKLNVWLGTMYQNTQQTYRGSIRDLHLPAELNSLMMLINGGRFEVKQRLASPWNVLVGAQYSITRNFNISTELGFAKRNSVMLTGEFRF